VSFPNIVTNGIVKTFPETPQPSSWVSQGLAAATTSLENR
jgi:hypothetical protein